MSQNLECNVTAEMFEKAFSFALDYFCNPDKVIKDRTGTKQRGLGQILDDQMIGKIVESGVCKILEQNTSGKKIIPDNDVKGDFEYGQPDIVSIEDAGQSRAPTMFIEIKNSPKNYEWIGVYDSQFDGMKKWECDNTSSSSVEKIFVIYASLIDKFGERIIVDAAEEGYEEEWVGDDEKERIEKTKSKLLDDVIEELSCNTSDAEKIINLDEGRKDEFNSLTPDTQRGIQNFSRIKITFKKRKKDVLGSFLKHKNLSSQFDFFIDVTDFKVKIDYVVYGSELDPSGLGEKFSKNEVWPSPEIFSSTPTKIRSTGRTTNGSLLSCLTDLGKKSMLDVNTLKSNTTFWLNQTYCHYPKQFGELQFSEEVNVFLHEKKSTAKLQEGQTRENIKSLILENSNDVVVSSPFLGTFNLPSGAWKIKLFTKLESLKIRDDFAIAKRYYDQNLMGETPTRIETIAQNI